MRTENKQYSTTSWYPQLKLVPPYSEDFGVYGDKETVEYARQWAFENRIVMIEGVPACAHGMYMMSCPANPLGQCQLAAFDHLNLWAEVGNPQRPDVFMLSHPYMDDPHKNSELVQYAKAHGLRLHVPFTRGRWNNDSLRAMGQNIDDSPEPHPSEGFSNWYGHGSSTVELHAKSEYVAWPIEREIIMLLAMSPISWGERRVCRTCYGETENESAWLYPRKVNKWPL